MGLLPDTQNRELRMCQECREHFPRHRLQRKPLVSDPGMHQGTCGTHVPWCMSGSLNHGGGGNRSRHSRRMRNSQFYVSGKRPIGYHLYIKTLWPRQNGHHFPDDIFKCIFLNENVWILIKISLKCVPEDPINNIPALVQIMAWRLPGDKPFSELMLVSLLTHICITRPQRVSEWVI